MPLGYNPKDLPKIAAFPEPSDDWQAGGVFEWTGPRAAPEGTMLQSPFVLNPATVKNAKTQNAVKIASMDVPSPGEPRPGRKNAFESAPSRDATIKNMATKEGASPDAQLAKSPGGLPYFTDTTSQPGIEKITVKGQSPLFTNMGGAGAPASCPVRGNAPSAWAAQCSRTSVAWLRPLLCQACDRAMMAGPKTSASVSSGAKGGLRGRAGPASVESAGGAA